MTCSSSRATGLTTPMRSPSWRICCSPMSWPRGCRQRAIKRWRWPLIPALPAPGRAGQPFARRGVPAPAVAGVRAADRRVLPEPALRAGRPDAGVACHRTADIQSFAAVPVAAGQNAFGMLMVDTLEAGGVRRADVPLIRLLAGLLADALRRPEMALLAARK